MNLQKMFNAAISISFRIKQKHNKRTKNLVSKTWSENNTVITN